METLRELSECKEKGTNLVTLIMRAGSTPGDVSRKLVPELSASSNIKSRVTRQKVQRALRSILAQTKSSKPDAYGDYGVAIFSGQYV